MSRFVVNAVHFPGHMEKSAAGHREILAKLKAADVRGVEKLITIHYLDADEFQKYWDKEAAVLAKGIQRMGKLQ